MALESCCLVPTFLNFRIADLLRLPEDSGPRIATGPSLRGASTVVALRSRSVVGSRPTRSVAGRRIDASRWTRSVVVLRSVANADGPRRRNAESAEGPRHRNAESAEGPRHRNAESAEGPRHRNAESDEGPRRRNATDPETKGSEGLPRGIQR